MSSGESWRVDSGSASASGGVLARLRIRARILLIVAVAGLLTLGVGGIGFWQIQRVSAKGNAIYTDALLPMEDLGALRDAVGLVRIDGLSRVLAAGNAVAAQDYTDALIRDEATIGRRQAAYSARRLSAPQRQALQRFWVARTDYRDARRTTGDQLAAQHRMVEWE